ncbi:MAG TPA: 7-carboxy-7-deazaguanine synthase QueE [Desulfuromonadales bacterium]|nr:7-carboxy-7-deazaguanine synthase QueE [Desulfuromonadales bacterium]
MPAPATQTIKAQLIEVFSSIQGEGVLLGCRQAFVRFAECNLDCAYCDTPFHAGPAYRQETAPGSARFADMPNPADLSLLGRTLRDWEKSQPGWHHSLCLTGGEPLLHADALLDWLPSLVDFWPVYLETNGTLPEAFGKISPYVTWVSMDLKTEDLTGVSTAWEQHSAFLQKAGDRLCQVKLIVSEQTQPSVLRQAAALVARLAPAVPLVLQPRTVGDRPTLAGQSLLALQATAAAIHHDTRLIPQIHPLLGIA